MRYASLSWMLLSQFNIDLYGAYEDFSGIRARALFNEGGPYGLYAVSVLLVAVFAYYNLRSLGRWSLWLLVVAPVGLSLMLSGSKSGMICLIAVLGWAALTHLRAGYLIAGAVVGCAAIAVTPILDQLGAYWNVYQNYETVAAAKSDDLNIVAGRVAAMTIIPEMTAAHPLLGVGLGNYALMRGTSEIDVPSPDVWDVPGCGLSLYAAELGIPLFLLMLWNIWWPIRIVRKSHLATSLLILVAFQFFAQLIEVQATFFYPWFVTALGFGFYLAQKGDVRSVVEIE